MIHLIDMKCVDLHVAQSKYPKNVSHHHHPVPIPSPVERKGDTDVKKHSPGNPIVAQWVKNPT